MVGRTEPRRGVLLLIVLSLLVLFLLVGLSFMVTASQFQPLGQKRIAHEHYRNARCQTG